jgi:hypothetical protein
MLNWGRGFDPGVFGRFGLAALAQPPLRIFVCLLVCTLKDLFLSMYIEQPGNFQAIIP